MRNWDDFDRFEKIIDKYMPSYGEGETVASQAVTAVNKLIYKWYNDGDVFDNTYHMEGWWNDLSSFANWLSEHYGQWHILCQIGDVRDNSDYEDLLWQLATNVLDESKLKDAEIPKRGSIYDCSGPFRFEEYVLEEEEDEDW